MLSTLKNLLYAFFIPLFIRKKDYSIVVLRSDNNKFVFNSKTLFEYLLQHSTLNAQYIVNDNRLRKELIGRYGRHFITLKSFKDVLYIAKAGTWVTDGGFPLKTPFGHNNRVLLNLWHGMPIKHIGLARKVSPIYKVQLWAGLRVFSSYYNAFCVTSDFFKENVAQSFLLDMDKVKVLGQPRNDLLFVKNDRDKILKELYSGGLPKYEKIVLYAPTYRDEHYGVSGLKKTVFFPFSDFKLQEFEDYLHKNQYIVFIRPHHLDKIEFKESERIRVLGSDSVAEIFDILNIFDMLISDYSGLVYDFLLLNRPLLLLPYDLEIYQDKVGMPYCYEDVSPAPKPKNGKDFMIEFDKLLKDDEYYQEDRQRLKNKIFQIKDNNTPTIYTFLQEEINKYR